MLEVSSFMPGSPCVWSLPQAYRGLVPAPGPVRGVETQGHGGLVAQGYRGVWCQDLSRQGAVGVVLMAVSSAQSSPGGSNVSTSWVRLVAYGDKPGTF